MKIYEAWSDSFHKVRYSFGFFESEEDARTVVNVMRPRQGASDPDCGVKEINVIPKGMVMLGNKTSDPSSATV